MTDNLKTMHEEAFAQLGDGHVAYIRQLRSEDVNHLFPTAPQMAGGLKLWALLGADGSPIMLSDSRDAILANAVENELTPVSVH
ncbi:DUF1150 domain-containing protein [Breoghania sp.]|uniref:BQ00720 family protein n=1 Tax=Breoghania sp. TaxID=2065378 RepID=UPI002633E8D7|nr:DUF1150 domain-containing protein [Breoghania sp.]MDJ0930942.1 DUF1150 domain-containing protein [Breoghania sp.]